MSVAVPEPPRDRSPAPTPAPTCRNCGAATGGAFCPACGQETALALPSARRFLKDAAGRYVALDGRLWRTLAALLFRPGHLTREYFAGRRRRYVRPARLFLVLSLVMFLAIRLAVGVLEMRGTAVDLDAGARQGEQESAGAAKPATTAPATTAPATPPAQGGGQDAVSGGSARIQLPEGAVIAMPGLTVRIEETGNVGVDGAGPVAGALRQRMQRFNALPPQERTEQVVLGTLRYGPYAMVVLLPAFALLLALAYAGRVRAHPHRPRGYAAHLVFAAHYHAFFFLVATLAIVVPWGPVRALLLLWALVYGLAAMHAVYGGAWLGVLARAWGIAVAYFVLFVLAMVGLVLAAVLVR